MNLKNVPSFLKMFKHAVAVVICKELQSYCTKDNHSADAELFRKCR